jgi:hypothetical protein
MIRIYHTSDLHDRRGIVPRLRELRAQRPGLLFDCGDSLRGSQTVYHRSEPIVSEIDAAGYDAQAVQATTPMRSETASFTMYLRCCARERRACVTR